MAEYIARGVETVENCISKIRTVPRVSTVCEATESDIPSEGYLYATHDDLRTMFSINPRKPNSVLAIWPRH